MVLQEQLLAAVSVSQTQICDQQQQDAQQGGATTAPSSADPSHVPTTTAVAAGGGNSTDGDWIMIQGAAGSRTAPASMGGSTVAAQMAGAGHDGDVVEAPSSSSAGAPSGTSAAAAPTAAVEGLMRGVDSYKAPEDLLQVSSVLTTGGNDANHWWTGCNIIVMKQSVTAARLSECGCKPCAVVAAGTTSCYGG
jgi:hypothetical protein